MNLPGDWVYGIWFLPGEKQDWMGMLVIRDDKPRLLYRFRYYADDEPFSGNDKKNFYEAAFRKEGASIEEIAEVVHDTANRMKDAGFGIGEPVSFVEMKCRANEPEFFEKISAQPWAHIKFVPAGTSDTE